MANCKLCGQWAGVASDEHPLCREAIDAGQPLPADRRGIEPGIALPRPLTAAGVFWAVFLAQWLFALTAGIVYAIVRALST